MGVPIFGECFTHLVRLITDRERHVLFRGGVTLRTDLSTFTATQTHPRDGDVVGYLRGFLDAKAAGIRGDDVCELVFVGVFVEREREGGRREREGEGEGGRREDGRERKGWGREGEERVRERMKEKREKKTLE